MGFEKGNISWNKGLKMTFKPRPYQKGKIPKSAFKKGNNPWNKGIDFLAIRDENNVNWKGDKAKPDAIHKWVIERLGQPSKCDKCGTIEKRKYHWSNISHTYKRDLSDWQRLCVPCHKRYDLDFLKHEKNIL